ncbi:hypothetical protein [Bradyrhizobium sp.]|uniref:hypothetical protein n=1 Tax=Bradyrhizobium sp. TaxID=376 RepID=UPI0023A2F8D4|nr:hypothetical protein [Bradyrhizobium sp.]MDE2377633.1 hypothetical protein [Bradyrhizobium sp.]
MAQARHQTGRDQSFDERLIECAREARRQAQLLPDGALRDALLEKARQYEAQIEINALFLPRASETKH